MGNREIHEFALKQLALFSDSKTREREVDDALFGERCIELKFRMDCGQQFISCYSHDAFYHARELNDTIQSISDPYLLGSAIVSKWRYITHWANEDVLKPENREWFLTAFRHLAAITETD